MAEKVQILSTIFTPPCKMPELDYPITPKENCRLFFEHKKPVWVPNCNRDMQTTQAVNDKERPLMGQSGDDWFGQTWEWVPSVGGHMISGDSWRIKEMANWENELKFPDLDAIDFSVGAEEAEKRIDRDRMVVYKMGNGLFERLLDLTDATDSLCFLLEEPESAKKFFHALADFKIKLIDKICDQWIPFDVINIGDDWGTQISTFFSPKTYEELIFPELKRIVDHIRARGKYPSLHSCGKIESLVPIFNQLDFVYWEAQGINDLEGLKKEYGNKLNVRLVLDRALMEKPGVTDDEVRAAVKYFVETYGVDGGVMANIWSPDPHVYTFTIEEMYRFSKEFYAK